MQAPPVEIERRFRILDPSVLPPLGAPSRMLQCYLPHWKIEIRDSSLCFEELILVSGLSADEIQGVEDLFEAKFTPRIRLVGDCAFVTVKGPLKNGARIEWEWEVPTHRVEGLVSSFRFPHVLKHRHRIPIDDELTWEVDIFEGENHGLVMAEIELPSFDHPYPRPDWLGPEVTLDNRFGNGALAREPWIDLRDEI
jgi:adenylate cyclase